MEKPRSAMKSGADSGALCLPKPISSESEFARRMGLSFSAWEPVLRGTAMGRNERSGYLWTRGFVPYLNTYPGRESPNPLKIDVIRGEADLRTVMLDVMSLTKLNFNACIYGDGLPVTLRFADSVGEILTAGPVSGDQAPLPFKHYI